MTKRGYSASDEMTRTAEGTYSMILGSNPSAASFSRSCSFGTPNRIILQLYGRTVPVIRTKNFEAKLRQVMHT